VGQSGSTTPSEPSGDAPVDAPDVAPEEGPASGQHVDGLLQQVRERGAVPHRAADRALDRFADSL